MEKFERVQKYIASCGVCSRRAAEQLIVERRVRINNQIAVLGDKIVPRKDFVTIDGHEVLPEKKGYTYVMLNKPRGYITTMSDEYDRKCVVELLRDVGARVLPVGRLDKESEGMLLLTDDGQLIYKLTHPSHDIEKRYLVTVRGEVSGAQLETLNSPILLDGRISDSSEIEKLEKRSDRTVLLFVLKEGRNRQIRKMCEQAGLEVMRLKRIAIGPLKLAGLKAGKWRYLENGEINLLKAL
ncbi:pseudouridine synthase [Feifania hominis]|uniref:rRNA pseudouridine synthase n=1 Tax=Feifania hominis TaxID=2763660 RepID=A0A926HUG2_9FIRM|nr:pseudouridine synthase [Feifania hominis]MBC8535521.1 rRNA pseudouridine synthase [Feifania hominis]